VQAELKQGVDTIYSTDFAFAAVMRDQSVVTWGSPWSGGDSSTVEAELKQWMNERDNVQCFLESFYTGDLASLAGEYYPKIQIYSSARTFFALLPNRTLLQWGKR
jgi:capsule polysaccharide export protein KpsC/LpsZ